MRATFHATVERRKLLEEEARGVMRLFDDGATETAEAAPEKLYSPAAGEAVLDFRGRR